MSMQANVENVGVVVEALLGAVSMVDGPVDDENPANNFTMKKLFGSDGNRVEKAETHRFLSFCMVAFSNKNNSKLRSA